MGMVIFNVHKTKVYMYTQPFRDANLMRQIQKNEHYC